MNVNISVDHLGIILTLVRSAKHDVKFTNFNISTLNKIEDEVLDAVFSEAKKKVKLKKYTYTSDDDARAGLRP